MKLSILMFTVCCITLTSCKNDKKKQEIVTETVSEKLEAEKNIENLESTSKIIPISHATAVLTYKNKVLYIDPTGDLSAFKGQSTPDLVFITDIHGDHLDIETLDSLDLSKAKIIVPQAVAEKLPASYTDRLVIINNGQTKDLADISVTAIPMYNLRNEALQFHPKGRGNGYVITLGNEHIYFSGDTEDIPEMRALENIDKAFICMNLPYTMTVESAADAVLAFKPKIVYPYHYRGTEGYSDIDKFKKLINTGNADIKVVQLDWYER